jgi:hypothetical protein
MNLFCFGSQYIDGQNGNKLIYGFLLRVVMKQLGREKTGVVREILKSEWV